MQTGHRVRFQKTESIINCGALPEPTKMLNGAPASDPNGRSWNTAATPFGRSAKGIREPESSVVTASRMASAAHHPFFIRMENAAKIKSTAKLSEMPSNRLTRKRTPFQALAGKMRTPNSGAARQTGSV